MNILLEKLIAARESWVDVKGFRFKVRRPTEMELIRLRKGDKFEITLDAIRRFVFDWANVRESHVVPGGASDAIPFDRDLYESWIEDKPHLWHAIAGEIFEQVKLQQERQEAETKNSTTS